jgi:hypothetical protein
MTQKNRPHGRITSQATEESVEQRARELARMDGRTAKEVTTSDRMQAKKELVGDDSADDPADDENIVASGMGSPPTSHGTHTKNYLPTDDRVEIETVQEGVDEAEHDEMRAASKMDIDDEK